VPFLHRQVAFDIDIKTPGSLTKGKSGVQARLEADIERPSSTDNPEERLAKAEANRKVQPQLRRECLSRPAMVFADIDTWVGC
jgi:hypothetical protein